MSGDMQAKYDALAEEMTNANADLQAKHDAAMKEVADAKESVEMLEHRCDGLMAENVSLAKTLDETRAAHIDTLAVVAALQAKYDVLQAEHDAALAKLPPAAKTYQYAEGECRPIPGAMGAECPTCGWTFGGKRPQDKEPHAVL